MPGEREVFVGASVGVSPPPPAPFQHSNPFRASFVGRNRFARQLVRSSVADPTAGNTIRFLLNPGGGGQTRFSRHPPNPETPGVPGDPKKGFQKIESIFQNSPAFSKAKKKPGIPTTGGRGGGPTPPTLTPSPEGAYRPLKINLDPTPSSPLSVWPFFE